MNRMRIWGFAYAISAAIIWGLSYTIDQKILQHSSPVFLIFVNALITFVLVAPVILFNGDHKFFLQADKNTLLLIIFAQILAVLASFFILSGIKILGASLASIFEIMYPFFVILFSYLMFGGTFNIYFWIGSSLLFVGSLILVTKT